jgi:outer membrane lipoprotein-sorting protein
MAARGATKSASIALAALVGGVLAVVPAVAQTVPLPTPAPWPKTNSADSAPATTGKPAAAATAPAASSAPAAPSAPAAATADAAPRGFFPFSSIFGKGATTAFDANQRALLDKVSNYLSGVQTLVGNFVQIGPDGKRVEGELYLQKPGKVRFEYKPPSPIDIVADGASVVVNDRSLETHDFYPLSQTPLRYLLADRIDLLRDTDVISVSADDTFVSVVIEETKVAVGTSRLLIMFDAKTMQLKQWTVTDPQGLDTTVAVYNLDSTKKPDPNLFVINYPEPIETVPHGR